MNNQAFQSICELFESRKIPFTVLQHPPCKTSVESAAARAAAGSPKAVGAKAILCKLYFAVGEEFAVFAMPGPYRLNVNAVKGILPGLKKLRFASSDEMVNLCGVMPGCMPPFGAPIFDKVKLYIDPAISGCEEVGFNAARFETSIVVAAADYLKAVAGISTTIECASPMAEEVEHGS